jgi:molecular chaperone GrpE
MTNHQNPKLQKELEEFKQKAEDYLNSWKRTAADFENYKKRREKEDKELLRFALEVTVVKILPTLESLESALKNAPRDEKHKKWSEGVIKTVQQLEQVLLSMGVEKIKTVGEKFDPSLHEAQDLAESDKEPGTVLEEIQTGYKLNNKIIRPAKVRVAR